MDNDGNINVEQENVFKSTQTYLLPAWGSHLSLNIMANSLARKHLVYFLSFHVRL